MKHIKDVTIKQNKITLRFVDRDYFGTIRGRQQITVSKYEFEKAMREAGIIVPWKDVK